VGLRTVRNIDTSAGTGPRHRQRHPDGGSAGPRYARRKFFDLHATNKSQIAEKALHYIAALYEVEREVSELGSGDRQRIRREKATPIIDALHTWMIAQRQLVPEGSAIAKAFSLKRWIALTRYLNDGAVPIDTSA